MLQFDPLVLPAVATLLITGGMTGYAARTAADRERGDRRLLGLFALMNAFGTLYAAIVTFHLLIADPGVQAFLVTLNGAVSPFAWAMICLGLFALEYTGRSHWISRPYLAVLAVFLLLYVAAIAVYGPTTLPGETTTVGSLTVTELRQNDAPIFDPIQAFAVGHHLLAIVLFGSLLVSSQPIYRKQGAVMTVGAISVIAVGIPLDQFTDYPGLYVTLAHFLPFIVFGLGLYRYKLVEYVPVARKSVIEEMSEGYLVVDDGGTVVDHNPTAATLLSHEGSLVGDPVGEILPESEPLLDAGDPEPVTVEREDDRVLSVTTNEVESASRSGHLLLVSDTTELKKREQDLDLLKQVLTRVFRHNIRNELEVVRGHAGLLEDRLDGDLDEHTATILGTTDRILDHSEKAHRIERVLDTDDRRESDLGAVVDGVVASARDASPDATITPSVGDPPPVYAHPEIEAAVEELVGNAIEHAPDGESAHVEIRAETTPETVTLVVEDESGGLESHELEVLDRGEETDLEHGSGVGLWLVRWIVDRSEGELLAETTAEGTRMGLELQRADATAATETGVAVGDG